MSNEYKEIGGLRWGRSFWDGANATWPFATLSATSKEITISVRISIFFKKTFSFEKSDIISIQKKNSFFSTGIIVIHKNQKHPSFILFWTFHYSLLKKHMEQLGYKVEELIKE